MTKAALRKIQLSKQRGLSPQERSSGSRKIADAFFQRFDLSVVEVLHSFVPIEKFNEVDTRLILDQVWRDYPQIETVVPRVDFLTNEITHVKFGPDVELARNAWDIDEPAHNEFVDTSEIDMVLVPGVAFDRQGHRVGYGKGFYDRFLKRCRPDCLKIGLSYFEPVDSIEDVYDGDVRLDFFITPSELVKPAGTAARK